ncbi:MAG: peptidyl-prolyl cis-trans isomerase A (cyclophilin A) [Myxococcota bacterium]|jgi:peptidyl-prolyl cis-trans isomerase A (cyclophilin A)
MRMLLILLATACGADKGDSATATTPAGATATLGTSSTEGPSEVTITTSLGAFTLELATDDAPKTVRNFVKYVDAGFYDGTDGLGATTMHRVVPGFVIQGGGLTEDLQLKDTRGSIKNEADNGLPNVRGSVAMARQNDPDSATAQWFVNLVDNPGLDAGESDGYAVFATVVDGMGVVDAIAGVPTSTQDGLGDVPVDAVIIESVTY